jgi:hypothetical protein
VCVVFGCGPMAGRLCVSSMPRAQGVDDEPEDLLLCRVPTSDVIDSGNDPSQKPLASAELVLGDVANVHSEDGLECKGIGARTGSRVLQDGLAHVAKVAAGHGTDRQGHTDGNRGSR